MATSALELRYRLRLQQRKFQIAPQPVILPLTDPVPHPLIMLGIAATTALDLDRMRLGPNAFEPLPDPRNVRLLLKHNPAIIVGRIERLHYDAQGNLCIRARVEHPEARRLAAFSPAFRVVECELRDADTANFHGVVHKAELVEVSLTDRPSNPLALVEQRLPACLGDVYDHGIAAMNLAGQLVQLMQKEIRRHAHG